MCHAQNSAPPVFGDSSATVFGEHVTLTSSDAATFSAYLARPVGKSRTGIVVLPDMRGLHAFYEQFAMQLAAQGHSAIVIDYFGRTAGLGVRDDSFKYMEHVMRITRAGIDADIMAAAAYLRATESVRADSARHVN